MQWAVYPYVGERETHVAPVTETLDKKHRFHELCSCNPNVEVHDGWFLIIHQCAK